MEIINVEQGTKEWVQARAGIPTASNFSKIVTSLGVISKTINDYALKLASECLVDEVEESFLSFDMQRGTEMEDDAIIAYRESMFLDVDIVGFIRKKDKSCGYSPDGMIGDVGIIEIKCPSQKVHTKYLENGKLPSEYMQQVYGGLYVSNREWCDFVSYNPSFKGDNKLFIKRVFRDEKFNEHLKKGIDLCCKKRDEILNKIKKGNQNEFKKT